MVTPNRIPLLVKTHEYLHKNLGAQKIYLVANENCRNEIQDAFKNLDYIEFLNEDSILNGLTLARVREILVSICGNGKRAGWFFQQFLKMSYAYLCADDYYLVFDSDTVPLNPIPYFSSDGKPQFITKKEYYDFYFQTMKVLFDGQVKRVDKNISYIAENMMINKSIMIEIIDTIMNNGNLKGETFYEKILHAIDIKDVQYTGFSEFETYGNYTMTFYPNMYNQIKLRTQRLGTFLLGTNPTKEQLEWASQDYDIISFESYGRKWLAKKTSSEKTRNKYSARELFNRYIKLSDLCDILMFKSISKTDD